ncbi:BnaA10g30560D [Brassica napus]|uniref:BnaA10g30560D protein n=1 Tax=Brassica napus TaxID=3708 RepID=A0A078JVL7_BRANA|nr:BnaA10g30560D [Brassica napus]
MKGSILLSMENHHPSTLLSMDSSGSSHEELLDLDINNVNHHQITLYNPPDINLPLSVGRSSPTWNLDSCDNILDVGLSSHVYETETFLNVVAPSKVSKKCLKRGDSIQSLRSLEKLVVEQEEEGDALQGLINLISSSMCSSFSTIWRTCTCGLLRISLRTRSVKCS